MSDLKIFELLIDETKDWGGVQAISIVENPAIEEDFIALKSHKIQMAEVDKEKRILMGAALIPNKKILRASKNGDRYLVYFSEKTVRRASELYLMKEKQSNSTLEHEIPIEGLCVVESWIVEDDIHDKSRKYGFSTPVGSWMVSLKVNNDEIWEEYVKTGLVRGFSIEGFFSDNADERPLEPLKEDLDALRKALEVSQKSIDELSSEESELLIEIVKEMIQ